MPSISQHAQIHGVVTGLTVSRNNPVVGGHGFVSHYLTSIYTHSPRPTESSPPRKIINKINFQLPSHYYQQLYPTLFSFLKSLTSEMASNTISRG